MKLGELGEFGLIERIRTIVGDASDGVVLGMGDDAAVLESSPGWQPILTTDTLVEGVHFHRAYTPVESLGWKALAVNLSDIAAMGGLPRCAVVSLVLTDSWRVEDVEALYRGMKRCGDGYGCAVVGGDTVRSEDAGILTVAVLGEVEAGRAVGRTGANEGDVICVTGKLGGARVGLEVLSGRDDRALFPESVSCFLEPKPLVKEARDIVEVFSPSSMIDISDGLSSEIHHVCSQSGVGCLLEEERLPIAGEVFGWAKERGESPADVALGSGEEYQLLFTVEKGIYEKRTRRESGKSEITVIGEIVEEAAGIRIVNKGRRRTLDTQGWDHFVS